MAFAGPQGTWLKPTFSGITEKANVNHRAHGKPDGTPRNTP